MVKADRECEKRSMYFLQAKSDRESGTFEIESSLMTKSDRESGIPEIESDLRFKSDTESETSEIESDLTIKTAKTTQKSSLFYFCPIRNGRYLRELPCLNEMYFSF